MPTPPFARFPDFQAFAAIGRACRPVPHGHFCTAGAKTIMGKRYRRRFGFNAAIEPAFCLPAAISTL
jgi:hypothetical protein